MMSDLETPFASPRYRHLFWFWGVNLILVFIGPDSPTTFRGAVIGVSAIPLLVAVVTSFASPEWFARRKNALLRALCWVVGALIYWILTNTGWWIRILKEDVQEGRPGGADDAIFRLTHNWDQFTEGLLIVFGAVFALILFLWSRGTPLSEIGEDRRPSDTTQP